MDLINDTHESGLNIGKRFLWGFVLKLTKSVLLKNRTRGFQNGPPFERLACFNVAITGNIEHFQCFNFETNFLKKENILQKLEYGFSVERTKIENEIFPYKTALSEANVMPCP